MSATSTVAQSQESSTQSICSPQSLAALKDAFEAFLRAPLSPDTWKRVCGAVADLAPADPRFASDLEEIRRRQMEKHGGFTQRFVLSKDVGPDGAIRVLPRSIPVRDETRTKLTRLVRDNPASFPGGIQQFLNNERPLQQAKSLDYARLIAATVRLELNSLLRSDRNKLLKGAATLLELVDVYRHMQRVGQAHPKVVETIDQRDTTAIIEFLVTLGTRTPLTDAELAQLVPLAARGWADANDRDLIVRGRVLQTGLDGKSVLLTSWVEPFAAEIMFCGLLPQLQAAYRKRQADMAASAAPAVPAAPVSPPPRPPVATATTGTFSAPFQRAASRTSTEGARTEPAPPKPPSDESLSDTAAMNVSNTGSFKIPIGVPQPPKLQVLRNYLRVSTSTMSMRLSEAMRLAEARDDVVGHRQYVQHVFYEARWAITGQTRGDPIFSRIRGVTAEAGPVD